MDVERGHRGLGGRRIALGLLGEPHRLTGRVGGRQLAAPGGPPPQPGDPDAGDRGSAPGHHPVLQEPRLHLRRPARRHRPAGQLPTQRSDKPAGRKHRRARAAPAIRNSRGVSGRAVPPRHAGRRRPCAPDGRWPRPLVVGNLRLSGRVRHDGATASSSWTPPRVERSGRPVREGTPELLSPCRATPSS